MTAVDADLATLLTPNGVLIVILVVIVMRRVKHLRIEF